MNMMDHSFGKRGDEAIDHYLLADVRRLLRSFLPYRLFLPRRVSRRQLRRKEPVPVAAQDACSSGVHFPRSFFQASTSSMR
jgi:hypothetical protein